MREPQSIRKSPSIPLVVVALICVAAGVTACGNASGDVVAEVGGSPITKTEVSHWMSTLAGGDYFELSGGHTVPAALASEPPDYAACVTSLEAVVASSPRAGSKPADLLLKCRQIYTALRIQALSYLVKIQWLESVYREEGVTVTEGEVQEFFKKVRVGLYETEAELHQYLLSRRESLADLMTITKLEALEQKAGNKIKAGGAQVAAQFSAAERKWTTKTTCRAGYVVEYCKQFKGRQTYAGTLPPAVLMEQVATLATGRCVNLAACGKT